MTDDQRYAHVIAPADSDRIAGRDGRSLPVSFDVDYREPQLPQLRLHFEVQHDGDAVCTQVTIIDPAGVTPELVSSIPMTLSRIIREAIAAAHWDTARYGEYEPDASGFLALDRIKQAAEVFAEGGVHAVASELSVSTSTAARYVREARERGVLPAEDQEG